MKKSIGEGSQNSKEISSHSFRVGSRASILGFLKSVIFGSYMSKAHEQDHLKRLNYTTPRNISHQSPVDEYHSDPKLKANAVKSLPSAEPIVITQKIVEDYLHNFYAISMKELNPFTKYNVKAVLFDYGAFLIMMPELLQEKQMDFNSNLHTFINTTAKFNIVEAFNQVDLDIIQCLPHEENENLQRNIKAGKPYFKGTNIIYDENKFIFIKDASNQIWHKQAAEEDIHRLKNEIRELPS